MSAILAELVGAWELDCDKWCIETWEPYQIFRFRIFVDLAWRRGGSESTDIQNRIRDSA